MEIWSQEIGLPHVFARGAPSKTASKKERGEAMKGMGGRNFKRLDPSALPFYFLEPLFRKIEFTFHAKFHITHFTFRSSKNVYRGYRIL